MSAPIPVVGIGADGLDGLAPASRETLAGASALYGSARQLALVRDLGVPAHEWPSPLVPALPRLAEEMAASGAAVLASGDPMFHGIGVTLARILGPDALRVLPAPSCASLAAARLGLPLGRMEVVNCVTADVHEVLRPATDGGHTLVLCRNGETPGVVASVLVEAGLGRSDLTVLGDLGSAGETRHDGTAEELAGTRGPWSDLCVVAVRYQPDGDAPVAALAGPAPGLDDSAYVTDGQLTRSAVRALVLSVLRPRPGEVLWDVGAGSGSVGIEWMRAAPGAGAVAVERDPLRAGRVRHNAAALGVPGLEVVHGDAPAVLRSRPDRPDAVFVGGGLTCDGVVEACLAALRPGGRLVAVSVTLESDAELTRLHALLGGRLTRLALEEARPLGALTGWTPARSVTVLAATPDGAGRARGGRGTR